MEGISSPGNNQKQGFEKMTEAKKKKIASLVWELMQDARDWGRSQGLKGGIEGTSWFNAGVNPDDVINKGARDTEQSMNELLDLLGLSEYQEHNYTPEQDIE